MRNITPCTKEGMLMREYILWYINTPDITKEELYRSWYGSNSYKPYLAKGSLDRFINAEMNL